jgi:hypothetical protein
VTDVSTVDFDLFISYASEDFDLCVADFLKSLWRHGVTSVWHDRLRIDVRESIPLKIDEGLSRSTYMLCILSEAYFRKFWTREELDAMHMQQKQIIPIWVDTGFHAVNAFSPALATKKAIIYDGDADQAMSVVARILLEDNSTKYHAAISARREAEVFWGMVWFYLKSALGILESRHSRAFSAIFPGSNWKQHVEAELCIDRKMVRAFASKHDDLDKDEQCFLLLAILKRKSSGWFPTYDQELSVLRRKGVSDW